MASTAKIYIKVGQSLRSASGNYYKVLEFLGNGANAYAYRCLCTSGLNRGIEFVIKIQYNLSTETRRERFLREAEFLRSCNHPAILMQYDYGTFVTARDRYPFIVTNYMQETLLERMKKEIPFDLKVKFACQLLSAVSFLQRQHIIHRDIKPNNIFINNDSAILGDFGLIKKLNDDDSTSDTDDIELVKATLVSGYAAMARYYRTPELVDYANHRAPLYLESDIFQLGLVLTEMFTGKNPLRPAGNLYAPIELDDIEVINAPHHSAVIRNILMQMLQIDRSKRIGINSAMDKFTGIYVSKFHV